jgi:Protein of unknown function (DUF2786)
MEGRMQTKSQDSTSSIAQRIKKLLALADGNKNEHERSSAMKLAMELLSKHNLDMAAVADLSCEHTVCEFEAYLKLDPWVRFVVKAACKLYYTEFIMRPVYRGYYGDRKEYHPTFVGTEENIVVTLEVLAWLLDSIRWESNCLFYEAHERRSFRLGAAHKLFERACQLVQEECQSASTASGSTALTVLRNELERANKRYLDSKNLGTFKARATYSDSDAYDMGSVFGNSVNLGKKSKIRAITMQD